MNTIHLRRPHWRSDLDRVGKPFEAFKKDGNFYPCKNGCSTKPNEAFVYGIGYVKFNPKKVIVVTGLKSRRAEDIKEFFDRWGWKCTLYALGLENEEDCCNTHAILNLRQAVKYGKAYDDLIDFWEDINKKWLEGIQKNLNIAIRPNEYGEEPSIYYLGNEEEEYLCWRVYLDLFHTLDHYIGYMYFPSEPLFNAVDMEKSLREFAVSYVKHNSKFFDLENTPEDDLVEAINSWIDNISVANQMDKMAGFAISPLIKQGMNKCKELQKLSGIPNTETLTNEQTELQL